MLSIHDGDSLLRASFSRSVEVVSHVQRPVVVLSNNREMYTRNIKNINKFTTIFEIKS
jgi:hypothetical protein